MNYLCTLIAVSFRFEWLFFSIHPIVMSYLISVVLCIKSIRAYVDTKTRLIEHNIEGSRKILDLFAL